MASHPSHSLPEGFQNWSPREKLEYVTHLWDVILEDEQNLPVHPWQREAVHKAKQTLKKHPDKGRPWRQEHERLRERIQERLSGRDEE